MTTQELIHWIKKAQDKKESTWNGRNYTISDNEAIKQTAPGFAVDAEVEIACCMISLLWNEVQEWDAVMNLGLQKD